MTRLEQPKLKQIRRKTEIRICIPVIGKSMGEFIDNMRIAQSVSNLIELRVDFIEDIKLQDIAQIKRNIDQESIFTCRRRNEGGQFQGSEVKRIAIIEKALNLGFDYIDIELSTLNENQLDLSKKGKTKLIVSFHNFEETPNEDVLRAIIENMKKYQPDIIKIATQVIKPEDNYKLFRLMLTEMVDLQRIIIGMGKLGKITRIVGPVLGCYLTFASVQDQISAQGQIDINQLRKIYKLMRIIN